MPKTENAFGEAVRRMQIAIAAVATLGIIVSLALWAFGNSSEVYGLPAHQLPLIAALLIGGFPLIVDLLSHVIRGEFGSDLLAGIAIVVSAILGEYLAGTIVVLMLSGGEALETYAVRSASSVLAALARRMPSVAHRKTATGVVDIELDQIAIGDSLEVFPHEICPVDGTVLSGHSTMDEAFLTGEPYLMPKTPGSTVISGAINGESMLTIRADRPAQDSRYAKIMQVMRNSEQSRPRIRRLAERMGAWYTPLAVGIAAAAWAFSGEPTRFLAVLVVATPCPLLIAIPVAIIGSISLCARRGIIVRDPAILEKIDTCRIAIFDKTGTLTHGRPKLTEVLPQPGFAETRIIALVASLERYSKHPLAMAVQAEAEERHIELLEVGEISEKPGEGLRGTVHGSAVQITSRSKIVAVDPTAESKLPPRAPGMECIVGVDGKYAAAMRFRDRPRAESRLFVDHLAPSHKFERLMIVSGDRESEVRYLADLVGIHEVFAGQSPEQKLEIVRKETARAATVFLGDGINDAPALAAATVGIAFGQNSDITSEAAGAVILESSLERVDELLHIGRRMRNIALQSAVGGMGTSIIAMLAAAFGFLNPVAGAILQEAIDVVAVVNALRAAWPPKTLSDL